MKRKTRNLILNGIALIALAVLFVSLLVLGSLLMDYKKSNDEYDDIINSAISDPVQENQLGSEFGNEEEGTTQTEEEQPFQIDWEYLHKLNPDIVAWIRFPNLPISYPVLKGKDNDQYLRTTPQGQHATAGSIFMDSLCEADFSSSNTIIYGHNMRNGSMFGSLKRMRRDESVLRKNEYFWIYTEDYTYKYEIFALGYGDPDKDIFYFIDGPDEMKQEYIDYCVQTNMFKMDRKATIDDSIVTLSTCRTDRTDMIKFQVHAVRTLVLTSDIEVID